MHAVFLNPRISLRQFEKQRKQNINATKAQRLQVQITVMTKWQQGWPTFSSPPVQPLFYNFVAILSTAKPATNLFSVSCYLSADQISADRTFSWLWKNSGVTQLATDWVINSKPHLPDLSYLWPFLRVGEPGGEGTSPFSNSDLRSKSGQNFSVSESRLLFICEYILINLSISSRWL